jgi:hypothetical protein
LVLASPHFPHYRSPPTMKENVRQPRKHQHQNLSKEQKVLWRRAKKIAKEKALLKRAAQDAMDVDSDERVRAELNPENPSELIRLGEIPSDNPSDQLGAIPSDHPSEPIRLNENEIVSDENPSENVTSDKAPTPLSGK